MRRVAIIVAVLGALIGGVGRAEPGPARGAYIAWEEDRYTETWSWVLGDVTIEAGENTWRMLARVQVRDHGRAIPEPSVVFTLAAPLRASAGYVVCPDMGIIVDGKALQGIVSQWNQVSDRTGTALKTVTFTVSLAAFRKIAAAGTVEARLCTREVVLDAPLRATMRAFAARVRSGRPPAAERPRYRDEQLRRDFAGSWTPGEELRRAWHLDAGEAFVTSAGGAHAQTLLVASARCGAGLLAEMKAADTPPLVAAGFLRIECVGGGAEAIDLQAPLD
jgi:hypothetical protein